MTRGVRFKTGVDLALRGAFRRCIRKRNKWERRVLDMISVSLQLDNGWSREAYASERRACLRTRRYHLPYLDKERFRDRDSDSPDPMTERGRGCKRILDFNRCRTEKEVSGFDAWLKNAGRGALVAVPAALSVLLNEHPFQDLSSLAVSSFRFSCFPGFSAGCA